MKAPRNFLRYVGLLVSITALTACSAQGPMNNLSLRKPAYHSSSIDYNATAQLAVDGIVETQLPCRVEVCGNGGVPLSKREQNLPLEPRQWTAVTVDGPTAELSLRTIGFTEPVDQISMTLAAMLPKGQGKAPYKAELARCDADGNWTPVKTFEGTYPGGRLTFAWDAPERVAPAGWRFQIEMPDATAFEWQEWRFYRDGALLPMLTLDHFHSAWVSATGGREWISVDLGKDGTRFREVRLNWLNAPAAGVLQVSDDSTTWRDVAKIGGSEAVRCDTFKVKGRGRWVRLLLDASVDGEPYVLTEMEVMGRGAAAAAAEAPAQPVADGPRVALERGWQLARLPQADDPSAWIPATVPGTVLASYLDNKMLPDPNFSDNQLYISDSYFNAPFRYRLRFALPADWRSGAADERIRLNFDGINWKADVVLNDKPVGRIEGAYTDASFDVTPLLAAENVLEVTVYPPAHPGMTKENTQERCATNGGILGADNPTFHASIGWDWIPTIRGRNMGIWNDVWMERTGPVRILNPTATTRFSALETLPPKFDTTQVMVTLQALLANDADHAVETVWEGNYGDVPFSVPVTVPAGGRLPVATQVLLNNPKLWWPNGYGAPNLYEVKMRVGDSHSVTFQSGVRQFTYSTAGGNLRIWINGRRLVGRGGNWGFSESNLRFHSADYETAMELHRHENFNLVRNWVGMVGDEEFYEAADRNGILVWQDFWLANPADGPDPDDEKLFMENAENMLFRVRKHPSVLLWCGRNEGYPPATLDQALRALVAREDPQSIYISSSADDVVSGRGPYFRLPSKQYFQLYQHPWYPKESAQFHSERGMPNFPNWESLVRMMRPSEAWPPSRMWGIHDFALESAQRGQTFVDAVNSYFGTSPDGETFAARAQWVNYDAYRALFESRSRERRGLLLWMSHSAWPSMAFCTYDWFWDATASYYACRKACEPIHIQWNPLSEKVEVVNYYAGNRTGLRAVCEVRNLDGAVISQEEKTLNVSDDTTLACFTPDLAAAKTDVRFLRLELYDGETLLSHNDYVLPKEEDNLQALNVLPQATVRATFSWNIDLNCYVAHLENTGDTPALMLHLTARDNEGDRILPAYWSDNYIHLMPGEERTLTLRIPNGSYAYRLTVDGFNLDPQTVREEMHLQVVE